MTEALPRWEDPRKLLARHGLSPKRGYSQNFLIAKPVVDRIAGAVADRCESLHVLEVGPGLGTLTAALLRRGLKVWALEADPDMRRVLSLEFADHSDLQIVAGDASRLDFSDIRARIGADFTLAGNLPYAITGTILRQVTESPSAAQAVIFLVQREVRDRLLASPGSKTYGALSVFVQRSFAVQAICPVGRGCFHPAPKVDSAVIALSPLESPRAATSSSFDRTVRAAFELRRKTLRNALLRIAPSAAVDAALASCKIDPRRRGETLSVEEFATLSDALARISQEDA